MTERSEHGYMLVSLHCDCDNRWIDYDYTQNPPLQFVQLASPATPDAL